jgi:hypothetical protein
MALSSIFFKNVIPNWRGKQLAIVAGAGNTIFQGQPRRELQPRVARGTLRKAFDPV